MSDIPAESSLMQATAKNIEGLQRAVVDLQGAANAAREDAAVAKSAAETAKAEATRWQKLTRLLGIFVLGALIASGLSIYNWVQQYDATSQLRQETITSCKQGNSDRAAEILVWDHILNEFLVPAAKPAPTTVTFVNETKMYLKQQLAARNCTQAYAPKAAPVTSATPAAS